jgi:hypothetical protein
MNKEYIVQPKVSQPLLPSCFFPGAHGLGHCPYCLPHMPAYWSDIVIDLNVQHPGASQPAHESIRSP